MKIWSKEEEDFLIENYPQKGIEFCLNTLNKSKPQIKAKVQRMRLKLNKDEKYKFNNFEDVIKRSKNLMDVCRNMKLTTNYGNRQTIKNYIKLYGIDTSHFFIPTSNGNKKININDILIEDSSYRWTTSLKEKLYDAKIKMRICEICGQDENWKGAKISLILDHINGINNDNRIENLRIVCPNCNAGLNTFCRGNKSTNII